MTAEDQGSPARSRTARVNVEVVERQEDLPPDWQPAGSTELDEYQIEIPENEPVKDRLPQVLPDYFLL